MDTDPASEPAAWIAAFGRAIWPSLLLFFAVVLVTAGFTAITTVQMPAPVNNTVRLPLSVYPPDGVSAHVESRTVHASDISGVDSLYFRMHQPYYHVGGNRSGDINEGFDSEGAVSIRVNGGNWVDVRNENVDCAYIESERWCVGGTSSTLRFTIPASAFGSLQNGANTVDFRWNGTDEIRSGFRVLAFGFMTPADPHVEDFDGYPGDINGDGIMDGAIDQTTFEWYDPSTWSAPSGGNASNGESLWSQRNLLEDGDGSSITAACADCHFRGGEDLKYFNYSNESITARSRFHGLTQQQGEDIAAYIRSITLRKENGASYEAPGSPWDPPFQPGPEMLGSNKAPDQGDQVYWMAGAGLRWVLDKEREQPGTERDMLAHIFPKNGDPSQGIDYIESGPYVGDLNWHHIHTDSTLDIEAIPINQQLPDWNNWLPDIHPLDFEANFLSTDAGQYWQNEFYDVLPDASANNYFTKVKRFRIRTRNQGWPKDIDAEGITNPTNNEIALSRLSAQQFRSVILLDLAFNNTDFEVSGEWNCGTNGNSGLNWCEPRTLPGGAETIFRVGPHVNGTYRNEPITGYGSRELNDSMTHLWYHVQVLIDAAAQDLNSVDWNYQNSFLPGENFPLRQLTNYSFQSQLRSNPRGNALGDDAWSYGGVKWNIFYKNYVGVPFFDGYKSNVGGLSKETTGKVLEAIHRSWYDYTKQFSVESFPRDNAENARSYDDVSYGPEDPNRITPPFEWRTWYYTAYRGMAENHASELAGILDTLTTWAGQMWPKGNDSEFMYKNGRQYKTWDGLVDYTPPSTGSQTIGLAQGWNLISSRINPSEPAVESVFGGVDSDLSLVKNEAGDIYSPGVGLNNIGDWQSREGYLVYMTNSQSMSVSGYGVDPTTSFMLEEGWNLIPYYPDTGMTPEDAFASISSELVLVKNQAGETYVPDPQDPIDDIGQLQPGQAYKVYVSSPVSFSYPSSN
jgi:hypothetical protein